MGIIYKSTFLLLTILLLQNSIAQDFDKYQELTSTGKLPNDFLLLLSDKNKQDFENINKRKRRRSKKVEKQFYVESNYATKQIITSGNVLFNDTLTRYINSVYQNIKKANSILQRKDNKVRFYTSKSTIINAYATHSGIIFINMALLAKVNTEDELAYILCHEIAHYLKKHNINQYKFNNKIDRKKGRYTEVNWEKKMFSKANYSQKQETEADIFGLELFLNSDYNPKSAIDALNSLKSYNLPFSHKHEFAKKLLENKYISLSEIKVTPIDSIEVQNYDEDNYSTHPDIEERIKLVSETIAKKAKPVSQTIDNKAKKIAKYELSHLFLEKSMYYHALYTTLTLLQENEESAYLNDILGKTLYALSQSRTYFEHYPGAFEEISLLRDYYEEYNSSIDYSAQEIQQLYLFIQDISDAVLNDLAISTLWKNRTISEKYTKKRCQGLLLEHLTYFNEDTTSNTVDLLKKENEDFLELFNDTKTLREKNEQKKKRKTKSRSKQSLLVLSPEYRKFDLRKEKTYKYEASEKALKNFHKTIKNNASKLDIKATILSPSNFRSSDISEANDLALLTSFVYENAISAPNIMSSKRKEVVALTKKYRTNKIAHSGIYTFRLDKSLRSRAFHLIWSGIALPALPYGIWYNIAPQYTTYNIFSVIDLETEALLFQNEHRIKMKDGRGSLNSSVYYNFVSFKKSLK